MTKIGPNVKRLLIQKMSHAAIPDGAGLAAGLEFLSSKESIMKGYKAAEQWVKDAFDIVRSAADPNPYRESSDEEIAGVLLKRIEERKREVKS